MLVKDYSVNGAGRTHSTCAYPSESHSSLCPEAIVLPMLESMAPGSTALHRIPSLRNRQATFLVAPIYHGTPLASPFHSIPSHSIHP